MPADDVPSPTASTTTSSTTTASMTSDEDDFPGFMPVLARLRRSEIPAAAFRLWRNRNPDKTLSKLPMVGKALHGSYNILFPVKFPCQGTKWLLKIPINGTEEHWDELSEYQLESEARTMQFIKRRTSIPLPEVLGFSPTLSNPLGCPHIWLSFIAGVSLYHFWFQNPPISDDDNIQHFRRTQILKDVVSAMVQLGQFRFPAGGRLLFEDSYIEDEPTGVGSQRQLDDAACFQRYTRNPPDRTPVYFEAGPFETAHEFYTHQLDREAKPPFPIQAGEQHLLRFFLDCINDFFAEGSQDFVLTHPDFDLQNFIVSPEDGRLVGIIDWDGVGAWPAASLGNLRCPSWLTRDWDPSMYGYGEDGVLRKRVQWEDPPETLQQYRRAYGDAVREALGEDGSLGKRRDGVGYETDGTAITESLYRATGDVFGRSDILKKIVDEILHVVDVPCETNPKYLYAELTETGQGEWKEGVKEALRAGLETLLRDHGESGW